jgi:hypothetical protein
MYLQQALWRIFGVREKSDSSPRSQYNHAIDTIHVIVPSEGQGGQTPLPMIKAILSVK